MKRGLNTDYFSSFRMQTKSAIADLYASTDCTRLHPEKIILVLKEHSADLEQVGVVCQIASATMIMKCLHCCQESRNDDAGSALDVVVK